jgi:hypothetical protein
MKTLLPLLLVATLVGCSSTRSQITTGPETGSDAAIESKLEMTDPNMIGEGNARRLEVRLRNVSPQHLVFLLTADWFDPNGRPVALSARRWIRLELPAQASAVVRVEPMPPEATSFRLRYSPAERR